MSDGGQAFPTSDTYTNRDERIVTTINDGMSLRDYFAAHANIASKEYSDWHSEALDRYRYADAMLAERERSKP